MKGIGSRALLTILVVALLAAVPVGGAAAAATPDRPSIKRYIEAWSRVTEKSRRAPLLCQQITVVSAS